MQNLANFLRQSAKEYQRSCCWLRLRRDHSSRHPCLYDLTQLALEFAAPALAAFIAVQTCAELLETGG